MLLFTTAFSLCGFVSMYFYDMMWLDALIWLPLVALGLHRIVSLHRYGLYTVSLTVTIISNYYMGYMTCLFSVMYFIYLIIEHQPTPFKDVWHMLARHSPIYDWFLGCRWNVDDCPDSDSDGNAADRGNTSSSTIICPRRCSDRSARQFAPGTSTAASHLYHAPSLFMGT